MAKIEFEINQTKEREETKFTEDGKQKIKTLNFKGVDDDGVVVKVSVEGPQNVIENKFFSFPTGPGIDTKMILSTDQQTLTAAVSKATGAKTQAADDEIAAAELDAELAKATN